MPPRKPAGPTTRSSFASKTAFDALKVEELESDASEVESEPETEPISTPTQSSGPMTRTAIKKAAKAEAAARSAQRNGQSPAGGETAAAPSSISEERAAVIAAEGPASSAPPPAQAPAAHARAPNGVSGHATTTASQNDQIFAAGSSSVPTPPAPFASGAPIAQKGDSSRAGPPPGPQGISSAGSKLPNGPPGGAASAGSTSLSSAQVPSTRAAVVQKPVAAPAKSETKPAQPATSASEESSAKWKKIRDRTLYTLLMIGGFIGLLLLGHPYMILLVMISQTLVYREVTALFNIPGRPSVTGRGASVSEAEDDDEDEGKGARRREELWSKTLSWYFFAVANYFLYGESIIYYFKHIVFVDAFFIPFARHHRFLSFILYTIGFVAFVSNLKRRNLKHQFGLFCWVHMSLLLIVFSSHFIVNNILEGLIWFWLPASLVICNDVFAYICGMLFGKTPLISLSPKKTVEGFVGAFIITEFFAYGWATIFQRFNYMICPAVSLGMHAWQNIQCEVNPTFLWHDLRLPEAVSSIIGSVVGHKVEALPYTPFQLHALVMAAFASLVAPFGGFFASGFKRAFNIKDFGDSIPGHGGLTDRFDCQFLMGLFSYVYYSSLIREHHVTVGSVLQTVVTHLTLEDQKELYSELHRFLVGQGVRI